MPHMTPMALDPRRDSRATAAGSWGAPRGGYIPGVGGGVGGREGSTSATVSLPLSHPRGRRREGSSDHKATGIPYPAGIHRTTASPSASNHKATSIKD